MTISAFFDNITLLDARCCRSVVRPGQLRAFAVLMRSVSASGDGYLYPVFALTLLLVQPAAGQCLLLAGLAAFSLELPLYLLLKNTIRRPRPCASMNGVRQLTTPHDTFSFPSGHTAAAFVMATMVCTFLPPWGGVAFAWAGLVGFSRVFLGVHYPTDVLAGAMLGLASAGAALQVV